MSVIEPDLLPRMERIVGDTDDHGGFPIGQAREIAGIGGKDRCDIYIGPAEDIDSLMGMTASHLIAPQKTDKSIRREKEWGGAALRTGGQFPVRVRARVLYPLAEFIEAGRVRPIQIIGSRRGGQDCNDENGQHKKAFG